MSEINAQLDRARDRRHTARTRRRGPPSMRNDNCTHMIATK